MLTNCTTKRYIRRVGTKEYLSAHIGFAHVSCAETWDSEKDALKKASEHENAEVVRVQITITELEPLPDVE